MTVFDQLNSKSKTVPTFKNSAYPEIGDASFRCALWTFKQQLSIG